jgi:hypothetical protein
VVVLPAIRRPRWHPLFLYSDTVTRVAIKLHSCFEKWVAPTESRDTVMFPWTILPFGKIYAP